MLKILKNKKGMGHIKTAVIVLIISMLFSVILSYAFIMTTVSRARDDTQRVLDGYCIEKSIEIYGSVKNGHKQMVRGTYTDEFMSRIAADLGLTRSGNTAFHRNGSNTIFRYTNPLTANLTSDTLTLTTEFEVVVPVSFAEKALTELRIPLKVDSVFVLKF